MGLRPELPTLIEAVISGRKPTCKMHGPRSRRDALRRLVPDEAWRRNAKLRPLQDASETFQLCNAQGTGYSQLAGKPCIWFSGGVDCERFEFAGAGVRLSRGRRGIQLGTSRCHTALPIGEFLAGQHSR